jgi:choline dehydrogenase-like flavoprotein
MAQSAPEVYDVCIVGSGAGGGMAAYALTQAGARVVMLEAGREWYSTRDATMLQPAWATCAAAPAASASRSASTTAASAAGTSRASPTPSPRGATSTGGARACSAGAPTTGAHLAALRPRRLQGQEQDGLGDDWPIGYDDVAPYYDRVDRLVGIFGSREGMRNHPDGEFLPPPKPRCYELLVKQASDKLGVTCIPSRLSILTKPVSGRAQCHFCGQCGRGCRVNANFSSPGVLIAPALKTGRLTLVTNAMAREVTVGRDGLATGVLYVDKGADGEGPGVERHVRAKIVVLAASALETARLLLNSRSAQFPEGLANSSGTVGKYITDTTGTDVAGFIPKLLDHVPHNEDGVGGLHVYMPWWLDNRKLDFPRGYHIEVWGGRGQPGTASSAASTASPTRRAAPAPTASRRCRAAATARSSRPTTGATTARSSGCRGAAR